MFNQLKYILLIAAIALVLQPEPSEANPGFFTAVVAGLSRWGVRLAKNSYYARCNTRNLPAGVRCPSVVFGWGQSRNAAQNFAREYARTIGDASCGQFVGHCDIRKLLK